MKKRLAVILTIISLWALATVRQPAAAQGAPNAVRRQLPVSGTPSLARTAILR
jgi:hypothetical protein